MVNPPKVTDLDYINFILASQRSFTCTEAARSQPADEGDDGPSHDAFTRLLQRMPQDTEALWSEAKPLVSGHGGVLVLDNTTLDKPYSRKMGLVTNELEPVCLFNYYRMKESQLDQTCYSAR